MWSQADGSYNGKTDKNTRRLRVEEQKGAALLMTNEETLKPKIGYFMKKGLTT